MLAEVEAMAERGANVTSNLQIKPSLFELIAQESLSEALYPAYKRVCTWLATNYPENFGWLSRWFDEVYLAYNAGVELDSLLNYAASYSEHFYMLQRFSVDKGSSGKLSRVQVWWSLASLSLVPYVRNKLEARQTATGKMSRVPLLLLSVLRTYRGCEMGCLFVLQFLHAWTSDPGRPRLDRLPIPPPPPHTLNPQGTKNNGKTMEWKCPVCLNLPSVPTVLPVSGYVFCFRCITEHLSHSSRCPVTKYPALARDLVRLNV